MKSGSRHSGPGLLALFRAWLRHHGQVARESLVRIRQTPLQSGLMIAVIAIAGSLPAALHQMAGTIKGISGDISRTSDIQVFMRTDVSNQSALEMADSWRQLALVEQVELIDPEAGRAQFESYSGLGSVLELLDENPLPAVIRLTPVEQIASDPAAVESLMNELRAASGVEQVQFDFQWLERLTALLNLVDRLNLVMGLLLGAGIVLVLINSIRLMIDNRKDEIIIVKLVGGSNEFVRRPLLYTGFWLGLLGGCSAVLLADLASFTLCQPVALLVTSYALDSLGSGLLSLGESLTLVMLCAALGLSGAWLAVAQHLDAIEPR